MIIPNFSIRRRLRAHSEAESAVASPGCWLASSATKRLYEIVRTKVPFNDHDQPTTDHVETVAEMFRTGEFVTALPAGNKAYDW
ncbi:MAG: hypothetical protein GY945_08650 [Rhodobacteraceae bacterium]|nr:hypothetical protein [Paracoccaceae bacterium]